MTFSFESPIFPFTENKEIVWTYHFWGDCLYFLILSTFIEERNPDCPSNVNIIFLKVKPIIRESIPFKEFEDQFLISVLMKMKSLY